MLSQANVWKAKRKTHDKLAKFVMGWQKEFDPLEQKHFWCESSCDDPESESFDYYVDEWEPTLYLVQAMQVARQLISEKIHFELHSNVDSVEWTAVFTKFDHDGSPLVGGTRTAKTEAEAICYAALEVKGL